VGYDHAGVGVEEEVAIGLCVLNVFVEICEGEFVAGLVFAVGL
jgi:hypothetical protein